MPSRSAVQPNHRKRSPFLAALYRLESKLRGELIAYPVSREDDAHNAATTRALTLLVEERKQIAGWRRN